MKAMIATTMLIFSCQLMASSFTNFGQTNSGLEDIKDIIIKTKKPLSVRALGFNSALIAQRPLIKDLQIHLLQVNPLMNVRSVLAEVRNHPDVVYAQLDHKVTPRNGTPNDTDFEDQWSLDHSPSNFGIDALSAWTRYGTGGKDAYNNDIVVAVVDGGVEMDHPDLIDNIWINQAEIEGNGIDDDNNGYVDDINGWSGYSNTGSLEKDDHGTHVAGTIGATGNNHNQVTGVNWDVKIMNVPGTSSSTSVVLRAYQYVLDQKKLWLQTNGAQGANVVSTNSSFGIDFANCNTGSYPAWNDIYNEMGEVGILSAAATMNRPADVDQQGDVPTGCDSPFIISVTNTRKNGRRASAAYGKNSIDLAAPGTNILSTVNRGRIGNKSGTSMATPHVAGAVAYLNSVASQTLTDMYVNDPAGAALEMKRIILETVTPTAALERETVSGGILNLNKAADMVVNYGMGQ